MSDARHSAAAAAAAPTAMGGPATVAFTDFKDMSRADSELLMGSVPAAVAETWVTILGLLRSLRAQPRCGLPVDQLEHALQSATRARRAGASDELVVVSLCHDLGKGISLLNHPAIAAEILRPFVSPGAYQIVRTHADFQGRFSAPHRKLDPEAYLVHRAEPWFDQALQFSDDWDCPSFDPQYDSLPLEAFEPLVRATFTAQRWTSANIHAATPVR